MERRLEIPVPVFYDLHIPRSPTRGPDRGAPLVLALHGYGQSKESMLRRVLRINETDWVVASIQGPHGFVRRDSRGAEKTGFNWGARYRHDEAVRVHHRIVLETLEAIDREIGVDRSAVFLLGFSQPVSFNYRFVFTHPGLIRGVIGICGGIPGDADEKGYQPSPTEVLHVATTSDEHYPVSRVAGFPAWLESLSPSVRVETLEGGHAIPEASHLIIEGWIRSRLGRGS